MNRSSRPTRTPAKLSHSINQRLSVYTLTATAAGVGLMALAQPVQAKIVYTPAHVNFTRFPPVTLDLNHDGTADFVLALGGRARQRGLSSQFAFVYAPRSNPSNRVIATAKGAYEPAVALRAGSRIGPGRLFGRRRHPRGALLHFREKLQRNRLGGPMGNGGKGLKNRYLGLKFIHQREGSLRLGAGYGHDEWQNLHRHPNRLCLRDNPQ